MSAPRFALRTLIAVVAFAVAAGCARQAAPPAAASAADAAYTVRAEIVRLPAAPGGELYLRHEAIPDFRDSQGETVGMASMTMPFGAPAELDLAGFAAGDRVEATFEVRWKADRMPLRVTRLARLPAGTALEFDPPPTDGGGAAASAQGEGETPR
jgi:Cu/Ag efflux protein CusF